MTSDLRLTLGPVALAMAMAGAAQPPRMFVMSSYGTLSFGSPPVRALNQILSSITTAPMKQGPFAQAGCVVPAVTATTDRVPCQNSAHSGDLPFQLGDQAGRHDLCL